MEEKGREEWTDWRESVDGWEDERTLARAMECKEYQPSRAKVVRMRKEESAPVEPGEEARPYARGSMPCGDRSARMFVKDIRGVSLCPECSSRSCPPRPTTGAGALAVMLPVDMPPLGTLWATNTGSGR